jgi:hypothetical protein
VLQYKALGKQMLLQGFSLALGNVHNRQAVLTHGVNAGDANHGAGL